MEIYTIGFTKKSAQEFFGLLRGAGIRRLIDVRLNNVSQLAFYDALETNDSAVQFLGDEVLRKIAQELVARVRANATVDWSVRESSRARMRLTVRKLLRKHKYPPDKQERATQTVLEQAELLGGEWGG